MFSSLHKLDIGCSVGDCEVAYFLQTDHRRSVEIAESAALSVVFAITRCLVAREVAIEFGRQPFRVVYLLDDEPPPFFAYVVRAAGATIARKSPSAGTPSAPPETLPRLGELAVLVADATARLADAVWKRSDLEPSLAGLAAYVHMMRRPTSDDEVAYYTSIVELGSLIASVLTLALREVAWSHERGIVPFALTGRRGNTDVVRANVFDSAQEFIDHGLRTTPTAFVTLRTGETVAFGSAFAAFEARCGESVGPEQLRTRALAGRADDTERRAVAESFARDAADALRAWGEDIGHEIRWVTRPAVEIDMRPIGKAIADLASSTYDDGVYAIFDDLLSVDDAIQGAIKQHGHLDAKREDWHNEGLMRSAIVLERRVPASAPRFAGTRYRETPNPFPALLAIWATGYLLESMNADGITLVVVAAPLLSADAR